MKKPHTQAAKRFSLAVKDLIQNIDVFSKHKKSVPGLRNIVFGGVVAKLFAEFENYISDSMSENIVLLSTEITNMSSLHENTIGSIIKYRLNHDHFKNYYASLDEKKFIGNLVTQFCKTSFPLISGKTNPLSLSSIMQTNGYPSTDNIFIIYWRLGVMDIFGKINAEIKGDSKRILESINSLRCEFIHESVNPSVTPSDMKKTIKTLEKIVLSIDAIVAKHVQSLIASI